MLERWNPTVKAFTVLICVILLSFEYLVSLNLLVLAVCLLLLMFCSRVSLKRSASSCCRPALRRSACL